MKNKIHEYKGKIAFLFKGSWYHRKKELLENGSTKYSRIGGFKTPDDAEKSYYECLQIYEESIRKNESPVINKEILFDGYLKYWFENVFSQRVKSTTKMITSYIMYNLILPNLPYEIKLKLITTQYINEILKIINELGKSTANSARETLNIALKEAVLEGYITKNPVMNSDKYKNTKHKKVTLLNESQIKTLLASVVNSNWYLEILLALFCGLRKGEILGLKFEDFELENKTVKISRQLNYNYDLEIGKFDIISSKFIETELKTENSYRVLRIPEIIVEELKKRKQKVNLDKLRYKDKYEYNNYICCQENGKMRGGSSLNTFINRTCFKNNLPKISVHSLRHMYATILIEQGVSLAKISAVLGHTSIHTTFEIYCGVIIENEKIRAFMNNKFTMDNEIIDEE